MKGHCLCGAVTITVPDINEVAVCHCATCRRWGGGPLFTVDHDGKLEIEGEDHIADYQSSDWAERAFCASLAKKPPRKTRDPEPDVATGSGP